MVTVFILRGAGISNSTKTAMLSDLDTILRRRGRERMLNKLYRHVTRSI